MDPTIPTVLRNPANDQALEPKIVLAEPLVLQSGETLPSVTMAYQTYGTVSLWLTTANLHTLMRSQMRQCHR